MTVGGTSKPVDRIRTTGHLSRKPDPEDRRASRIVLTPSGRRVLEAAIETYEQSVAEFVDPVLDQASQRQLHAKVRSLLEAADEDDTP